MNEIIGSLLVFMILTSLVFAVFLVSEKYLQQWRANAIVDREISLMRSLDLMIDEMKVEGKGSRRILYARLSEPMTGSDWMSFSHPYQLSRVFHSGHVIAGKMEPMNCTESGGLFVMSNSRIRATFSVKNGPFNLSDMFLSITDGQSTASINDFYADIGGEIRDVEGETSVYSSPAYCSITYNITSPINMTIKYSLTGLSDYVKMEVEYS